MQLKSARRGSLTPTLGVTSAPIPRFWYNSPTPLFFVWPAGGGSSPEWKREFLLVDSTRAVFFRFVHSRPISEPPRQHSGLGLVFLPWKHLTRAGQCYQQGFVVRMRSSSFRYV